MISRTGVTGELGYELFVPADEAAGVWNALFRAGGAFGLRPYGVNAMFTLGLEKLYPAHGIDMDESLTPFHAVSYTHLDVYKRQVQAICMNAGYGFFPSAVAALSASALVGFVNGALIAWLKMPSFVVTLGTLSIARSIAMVLSDNRMIFEFGPDQQLLFDLGGGSTFGIPHPVMALVIQALLTGFLLRWTPSVSYTHLDVYKRQHQQKRQGLCRNNCSPIPHFRHSTSGSPC